MVSPYTGDFNLRDNSLCIDAGDSLLGQDPDGTMPDQGALYFFQCPVFITLTPRSSIIIIPARGGSFQYDALLESNYHAPYTFDAWADVILPNGNVHGPLFSRSNLTINTGGTMSRGLTQYVPGACPSGFLYLVGKVGFLPDSVVACDSIPFMKLLGDGSSGHNQGWAVYGWDEELTASLSDYSLLSAYPNPFNPETHLSYTIGEAGNISLVIYDIQGKEIARLAEGWHPAGSYETSFDASALPSGVYFARLEANGASHTQKLLLVK